MVIITNNEKNNNYNRNTNNIKYMTSFYLSYVR